MDDSTEMKRLRHLAGLYPLLSREREILLAERWLQQRDLAAREELTNAHFRLVIRYLPQYRSINLSPADLFSEGCTGLMVAADKFDPSLGNRFSTYAQNWVRSAMQNATMKNMGIVRLSTNADERRIYYNLSRTKARFAIPDGEISPSNAAIIGEHLGVQPDKVIMMNRRMTTSDVRLDADVSEDGATFGAFLVSGDLRPDEIAEIASEDRLRSALVGDAMLDLKDRERHIISCRYLDDDRKTLDELGQLYGVTRERIRQIEAKALKKIQRRLTLDVRFRSLRGITHQMPERRKPSNEDGPQMLEQAA